MLPLRLVIDTNVLISVAIKPAGLQRTILLLAITKPARLLISRPILEEYREVLARPELQIRKGLRQHLLQLIKNHSYTVAPTRHLEVTQDPDDNMFLACADVARADYLVASGRVLAVEHSLSAATSYVARHNFPEQPHENNHMRIARGVGACYRHTLDVAWSTPPKPTFRSLGRFS